MPCEVYGRPPPFKTANTAAWCEWQHTLLGGRLRHRPAARQYLWHFHHARTGSRVAPAGAVAFTAGAPGVQLPGGLAPAMGASSRPDMLQDRAGSGVAGHLRGFLSPQAGSSRRQGRRAAEHECRELPRRSARTRPATVRGR